MYVFVFYICMSISSILHNRDYIQTHCNDRRNTFHFACRQWYSYNNPQYNMYNSIIILIFV